VRGRRAFKEGVVGVRARTALKGETGDGVRGRTALKGEGVRGRRPLKGLGDRALKGVGEGVRGRMAAGVVSKALSWMVSTPLSSVVSRGLLTVRATWAAPAAPRVYAPASAAAPPSPRAPVAPVASALLVRLLPTAALVLIPPAMTLAPAACGLVLVLVLLPPPPPPRCGWFASRASCRRIFGGTQGVVRAMQWFRSVLRWPSRCAPVLLSGSPYSQALHLM
jgi:hypothetical protein